MNKQQAIDIFNVGAKGIDPENPMDAVENFGAALGLLAMALERQNGIDRSVVMKMAQRAGYRTIKEMEQKNE